MSSLQDRTKVFLDTAPLIYLVERDARYLNVVREVFGRIDSGALQAVISPVSLAECLVVPYRNGNLDLARTFI